MVTYCMARKATMGLALQVWYARKRQMSIQRMMPLFIFTFLEAM